MQATYIHMRARITFVLFSVEYPEFSPEPNTKWKLKQYLLYERHRRKDGRMSTENRERQTIVE